MYKMNEERWNAIKSYLNKVWDNPDKYPDAGLLLSLSDEEISTIFTKKRLELVRIIQSKKPRNITALSKIVERKLSAVKRDLELLEGFNIVSLEKIEKDVVPTVSKKILILPLINIETKTLPELAKAIAH